EKEQDTFNITYALNLKALMLGKMGDVYEAHKMQLRSIDLIRKSGADRRLINPLLNIILNYIDFDQPDSVRSCLAELETKVDLFDPEDYYYYYQNWGSYFVMIRDYKRGIQQYQLALEVAETQKMTDARATCLMLLARA